jgi:hypothetical protein
MNTAAPSKRQLAAHDRRVRRVARGQPQSNLGYTLFWAGWVLAAAGVEFWALFRTAKAAGTLSVFWRTWVTGVSHPAKMPPSAMWAGRAVTLAFLAWLGPHLAFGWWG